MRLGDLAPDFDAETTLGPIRFHDWIGGDWCLFFSHPKDFTPVCTTELGVMAHRASEFARRGVRVIGLSVDPLDAHRAWIRDIEETQGAAPMFPIVADMDLSVAKLYGMLPAGVGDSAEGRTAADNFTVRSVFVIGPDKRIQFMATYPMSTGRSVEELLRVIDSLQLTARCKVATPAGWSRGDEVIILPALSDDEAHTRFPDGWRAPKPYLRFVTSPS